MSPLLANPGNSAPGPGSPELVVEVLGEGEDAGRLLRGISYCLTHGVRLLWVSDPQAELVAVWKPSFAPENYRAPDRINPAPVLNHFELDLPGAVRFASRLTDRDTLVSTTERLTAVIPEVRHKLVQELLMAGHWYIVEDESYTQRGEVFNARLSGFPRRGNESEPAAEVTGRISDVQAWKFKPAS